MTTEDWKIVEKKLSGVYGTVNLMIDGYKISVQRMLYKKNQLTNFVWINGQTKGKWSLEDCEERRRFHRPITRHLHSKKEMIKIARLIGKKSNLYKSMSNTFTYYVNDWLSISRMKSHFIKNNKSIELIGD